MESTAPQPPRPKSGRAKKNRLQSVGGPPQARAPRTDAQKPAPAAAQPPQRDEKAGGHELVPGPQSASAAAPGGDASPKPRSRRQRPDRAPAAHDAAPAAGDTDAFFGWPPLPPLPASLTVNGVAVSGAAAQLPRPVSVKAAALKQGGHNDFAAWAALPGHTYCGRDMQKFVPGTVRSPFHNPFKVKDPAHLGVSVYCFEERVRRNVAGLWDQLEALLGQREIGCWCKPAPCHTDVLVRCLTEKLLGLPPLPQEFLDRCPPALRPGGVWFHLRAENGITVANCPQQPTPAAAAAPPAPPIEAAVPAPPRGADKAVFPSLPGM